MKQGYKTSVINFITEIQAEKVAEIGIWKSSLCKSVLNQCKFIKEYYAIDPWMILNDKPNVTQQMWDNAYWYACRLMRYFPNLHVIRMTSENASMLFTNKYFDFVFIDGDHKDVYFDISWWYYLIKDNGFIGGHDYGSLRHPNVEEDVNTYFGEDVIKVLPGLVWIKKKTPLNI